MLYTIYYILYTRLLYTTHCLLHSALVTDYELPIESTATSPKPKFPNEKLRDSICDGKSKH